MAEVLSALFRLSLRAAPFSTPDDRQSVRVTQSHENWGIALETRERAWKKTRTLPRGKARSALGLTSACDPLAEHHLHFIGLWRVIERLFLRDQAPAVQTEQ